MTDEVVKYEFKEVRAIRGMEPRTIAKWEGEGWEFVSQEQSTLSSTLNFRRPKPKPPWILIGAGVAVAVIIAIGAAVASANGGSSHSTHPRATRTATAVPTASRNATPLPSQGVPPSAAATDTLTGSDAVVFLAEAWKERFKYGGTVHYLADASVIRNPNGTYIITIGADVKNAFGATEHGTIHGIVAGTASHPRIVSSTIDVGGEISDY